MVEGRGNRPGGRLRLVVIYGGRSAEHGISCVSACNVVKALDPDRYDVRLVGITTAGRWVDATGPALAAADGPALPSPDAILAAEPATAVGLGTLPAGEGPVVAFPLVHGPMGEDGTLQGLLELAGVPYCGPGVAGSAAAMDKGMAKALLASAGVPQARYLHLHEAGAGTGLVGRVERDLGWPVFVKPANMGSSIGITRVKDPGGLDAAVDLALRYDEHLVIEEAVTGRELEIAVLGWPDLQFSVPGEIRPAHDFYDFDDKYVDGAARLDVPADLPPRIAQEMGRLAVESCRALRVDSMARVDFFLEDGGRGLLVNEVNTIPGFTPISMYPRMWAQAGIPYAELVDRLVEQALRRAERHRRFQTRR